MVRGASAVVARQQRVLTSTDSDARVETFEEFPSVEPLKFLPTWSLPGVCDYIVAGLFFYLPLSMPLHIAVHQIVDYRSVWVSLAYPESVAILLLAVLVWLRRRSGGLSPSARSDSGFRWIVICACAYLLFATAAALFQGSDLPFAVRKLAMEWALPILLAVSLRRAWSPRLDALIRWSLIRGTFALLLLALLTYVWSFHIPRSFFDIVYVNRTWLIWRGVEGGVLFGEIPFGGVNPLAAHVGTVSCLVIGALLARERPRTKPFLLVWIGLAWLIEYLCFSRGILLFLFAAVLAFAINRRVQRLNQSPAVLGLTAALFLAATVPPGALAYWTEQFGFRPGSSAASRSKQWKHLADGKQVAESEIPAAASERMRENVGGALGRKGSKSDSRDAATATASQKRKARAYKQLQQAISARIGGPARRLLVGYGIGHYGILRGLVPDSGSHNIFFDALLEAGILGAASFALFFALGFFRRIRGWLAARKESDSEYATELARLLAFASIAIIGVLVDYRLENLGTMTGAGVLWYLLVSPPEGA